MVIFDDLHVNKNKGASMKIDLSYEAKGLATYSKSDKEIDLSNKEKKVTAKEITNTYLFEYQMKVTVETKKDFNSQAETFRLSDIGYKGKPIGELTQGEAKALVADDGFFGIAQTSQRIADFVIGGAGDDVEKLKAGRSGMLQGFKDAEGVWGGKLPEISYTTMQKAVEMVDKRLSELGGSVLDTKG